MGPSWAHAFVAAGLLTLAGTPLLRRVALATGFVDHPEAAHKSHGKATPYLGGIGLIAAVLTSLLFTSRLTPLVAVIALGGSLIGCLGLLDDHRSTGALFRFGVEAVVAVIAVAVGLRVHATDIALIDGFITIIWIVGVTNAVNLLDNMDGSAAGISTAAAVAIFSIAILGEQPVTAVVAAGLVGACLGFLAHNKRPASIFMGDTGSLFLGFILAVIAIDVSPALTPPASFAVPLMLLALPVLDTGTVIICRLRRGRSVALGGKDHLSHRLTARGMGPGPAVGVLIATEALVGAAAVLASRGVIPLDVATASTVVVLATLALLTVHAEVYVEPVEGLPRQLKLAALSGLAVVLLLAGPALVAMTRAHGPGIAGASATRRGLASLEAGDAVSATTLFDGAAADLQRAERILNGPGTSLGLSVPFVRANLASTRALVDAGRQVVGAGSALTSRVHAADLRLGQDADPATAARSVAPALEASASALGRAVAALSGYNRPYLWPSLGSSVRRLRTELIAAADGASQAADAARLVPLMLGSDGPRRYFLAVQDSAELRGGGGVIHFWGEVEANQGRVRVSRSGTVDELNRAGAGRSLEMPKEFLDRYRAFDVEGTWQNVNVSPDFADTGRVITDLYPQSGGAAVDGVVGIDWEGLAGLLRLSGPVKIDGWPEPLTSDTFLNVVLRESYVQLPVAAERDAMLGRAVSATLQAFASADLGSPARLALALGPAAGAGHLRLYASRPDEQRLAQTLGVAGAIPPRAGDSVLVVNQNLTAAPTDRFLRRQVRYDMRLDPGPKTASLSGRVQVILQNDAPVVENRTYLSVYTPLSLVASSVHGQPSTVGADAELGRHAYSTIVSIPPLGTETVDLELRGQVPLSADRWYHLAVSHQVSLVPDETEIHLSVPDGWRIAEARGMRIEGDNRASASLRSDGDVAELAIRLQPTAWSRLWNR